MKKKVLIIDDDPGVIQLAGALLQRENYEVINAQDGATGLRLAQEEKPDIIFLDIILPEMHGFEVCKLIKENNETKSIPVVIITASELAEIARDEPDVPADSYVTKPFGIDKLLSAIEEAEARRAIEER